MRFWLVCFLSLAAGRGLGAAALSPAQQAYANGIQLERAKNYQAGLEVFQTALSGDPAYFWAEREAGNCAYFLGLNAEAVAHYDRYLDANPSDVKFGAFVKKLRSRAGNIRRTGPRRLAWAVTLDGGLVNASASDIKQFISADVPSSVTGPDSQVAAVGGLQLAATYHGFLEVLARFDLGPFKSATATQQGLGTLSATLNNMEWGVVFGGRYCWTWDRQSIKAGLAVGPAFLSSTYTLTDTGSGNAAGTLSMNGMSWAIEPSAVYEFKLSNRWGVEGTLGYRMAKFSTIHKSTGTGSFGGSYGDPLKYSDGSAVSFDDSGIFGRVGLVMHLGV